MMRAALPMVVSLLAVAALSPAAPGREPALAALHHEEVSPGVHALGFADTYESANCGWIVCADRVVLVDLPRGLDAAAYLGLVGETSRQPARALLLTRYASGDEAQVAELVALGIEQVVASPEIVGKLLAGAAAIDREKVCPVEKVRDLGEGADAVRYLALDRRAGPAGGAVYLPQRKALFAGPLVVYGPRCKLPGSDTRAWLAALEELAALRPDRVIPGFGTWGGAERLERQRDFLWEVRRQVGYLIAQGRSAEWLREVNLPAAYLAWMPYDTPLAADLAHVYDELTVPLAPFGAASPAPADQRLHALVLIGDQPHEPGHIEEGLRPVFEATGVVPHFTVDVRALSAENLARVQLLVILRDGLQRPTADAKENYVWMTPQQERAIVEFVERGGGFLNLHNSMGLYPDDGPYLRLVGGRYIGHGPLERFRVEVVDRSHPVTRGVDDFSVADEQHTPPVDEGRVHLLLRNRSDEGRTAAAGWVRESERGRLCHLANGHTRESLLHPSYQRLLRNAVRWCLRQDTTEGAGNARVE